MMFMFCAMTGLSVIGVSIIGSLLFGYGFIILLVILVGGFILGSLVFGLMEDIAQVFGLTEDITNDEQSPWIELLLGQWMAVGIVLQTWIM